MLSAVSGGSVSPAEKRERIRLAAQAFADEDADYCKKIGQYGLEIIKTISEKKHGETVNILTHCNAGWLAFVDYGSALSPVYAAFDSGIKVHVWVDETRPRNQGASLTAWELGKHGVSHDLIPDNAGGHLMQHGLVDLVITGADRVTRTGDAANKIGTYLKALAAKENNVPFYVALPSTTFDFSMKDGVKEIPIEERDSSEVRFVSGKTVPSLGGDGSVETVQICPDSTNARNWAFDVTPARYITGFITERGVCAADEPGILLLFPEQNEGYVKFSAEHTYTPPIDISNIPFWAELNNVRTRLFKLGLIGVTPDGIGYGNVSIRTGGDKFLVSGTATGVLAVLTPAEYCFVNNCDFSHNSVVSSGPVQASSESMTHGAVYYSNPIIHNVIHIHSREIFDGMLRDSYPATPENAAYGTPEIAQAVGQVVSQTVGQEIACGVIVLAGHDEGIIAYGSSPEKACNLIIELYNKYK